MKVIVICMIVLVVTLMVGIAASPAGAQQCDPNYAGACVPVYPPDVNCPEVGYQVTVIGTDVHNLDGDSDGIGCEGYPIATVGADGYVISSYLPSTGLPFLLPVAGLLAAGAGGFFLRRRG